MEILARVRLELLPALLLVGSAFGHATERVSVSSSGEEGDLASSVPAMSADGRYVAFFSLADNLVEGDTNTEGDVFVRDRWASQTVLVSVATDGEQGNSVSDEPAISADGRYVAFRSLATNLVDGDTNEVRDVFVHDLETGETVRVSVNSSGEQGDDYSGAPSLSSDGRYIAFTSAAENLDVSGLGGVFVHDRVTGETTKVSLTNLGGHAWGSEPSISGDGRFVAFTSTSYNFEFGDPLDDSDIYLRDRLLGITIWVSEGPVTGPDSESIGPAVSEDGRFVAFASEADNLVPDGTGRWDAYVYEIATGELTLVSRGPNGDPGDGDSADVAISSDGRFVAMTSRADNLVPGVVADDFAIFVHDRDNGTNSRVSINVYGEGANDNCSHPVISGGGRLVAFDSGSGNLVPDGNGTWDVFVHDRGAVAARGHGRLLGSENTGRLLVEIDPLSGSSATIGPTDRSYEGLAYDPVNDILYAVSAAYGSNDLAYVIDRHTAEATPLGTPGTLGIVAPGGLAFDPIRGILYCSDQESDELYSINTTTGEGTLLTTFGGAYGQNIRGLAFDARSDTLFGLAGGLPAIVKIDPATGATVPVAINLPALGWGLSFDSERNVIMQTAGSGGSTLYEYDPGTGEATFVGPAGGPGARVFGLAFDAAALPRDCPADLNNSGFVEVNDFLLLLAAWGTSPDGPPDLDGDGIVAVGDFLLLLASWGECPAINDDCVSSIGVTEGQYEFSTRVATTDGADHPECDFSGASQIDNDLWFCYTASATGWATASLCGSDFDTKLAVYAGCGCPTPEPPLICTDDSSCGAQSQASFAVDAGETYLIRVGGRDGATGTGTLTINCQSFAVPNDACTAATPIFTPFVVYGTTTGALPEVGLPGCDHPISGPSVWYTVPGTGNLMLADICALGDTDFDTLITVYCGDCDGLVCVASDDDDVCAPQSQVTWCSEAGVDYLIAVHGFITASGDFSMIVADAGPCEDPVDCPGP